MLRGIRYEKTRSRETLLRTCMVIIRPSVRTIGETTVGEMVYDAFIWIFLRAHEDQADGSALQTGTREL